MKIESDEKVAEQQPEPPADLSERSRELWLSLVHRVAARGGGAMRLFATALRAADRADAARATIADGDLFPVSSRSRLRRRHPAIDVIERSERTFADIFSLLHLHKSEDEFQFDQFCDERERLVAGYKRQQM